MIYGDSPGKNPVPSISAIMQSANLYVYALNNPIYWIDPSGNKIDYLSGTKTQREAYERAISYLQEKSSKAAEIINQLMKSQETYKVVFKNYNGYDPINKKIIWYHKGGAIMDDGVTVMSAAMTLAHELGHAAQQENKVYEKYNLKKMTRDQMLAVENDNLSRYEQIISGQLKEHVREEYSVSYYGYFRTETSTDHGTIETVPRYWWTVKVLNNKNPWKP